MMATKIAQGPSLPKPRISRSGLASSTISGRELRALRELAGQQLNLRDDADGLGVKSVPALVMSGDVYHITFGAPFDDLR